MKDTKNVVVLKGGWCAERPVSLISGKAAAEALRSVGYDVEEIDVGPRLIDDLRSAFAGAGHFVVFNALHGPFGEDGQVQSILEFLKIPYTHSGVLSSALAMDKPRAKAVMRDAGLPVPGGKVVPVASLTGDHPMAVPYVVKPVADGSSFGVFIVRDDAEPAPTADRIDEDLFGDTAMVEPFIRGRELTVAVMGTKALEVTEITAKKGAFYDYDSKYADGGSDHTIPAEIPPHIADYAMDVSEKATAALGCRGLSRVDFRWDDHDDIKGLFILEVNTQPGLTPMSLAPEQAAAKGISFGELVRWMVEDASCLR